MINKYSRNIIFLMLIMLPVYLYGDNIKSVEAIRFSGLTNIPQHEILNTPDISLKGKEIFINLDSLEDTLKKMPAVKSYELKIIDRTLLINVTENEPVFLLCVKDGSKNSFVELDNEFRIVSLNRVYSPDLPLIYVTKADLRNNRISQHLKEFLNFIYYIQRSGLAIIKDISEMEYAGNQKIFLTLNGRKTYFSIRLVYDDFLRLDRLTGYFDMIKYYPDFAEMTPDKCIIR